MANTRASVGRGVADRAPLSEYQCDGPGDLVCEGDYPHICACAVARRRRQRKSDGPLQWHARGMAAVPETRYARAGDVNIAYQVIGDGAPDLLFVPTATFPIDLLWDEPTVAGHLRRLASFSRVILTDLMGVGSSDVVPIQDSPAMQAWTDGLVAVLDAVTSECVSVFAMSESALPAMLLTASHPHRVRSLVLWSPYASFLRCPEYPSGMPEAALAR